MALEQMLKEQMQNQEDEQWENEAMGIFEETDEEHQAEKDEDIREVPHAPRTAISIGKSTSMYSWEVKPRIEPPKIQPEEQAKQGGHALIDTFQKWIPEEEVEMAEICIEEWRGTWLASTSSSSNAQQQSTHQKLSKNKSLGKIERD